MTVAVCLGLDLDPATAERMAALPGICECNIGHLTIGEAIAVGLPKAIARMGRSMDRGRSTLEPRSEP